jgi:two-component system phosphate regulon sensor histidine kinase PhoR
MNEVSEAAERIARGELGSFVGRSSWSSAPLTSSFNTMSRRVEQLFQDIRAEQVRRDALLNASTDGVLALSADTTVRLANTAAGRLLDTPLDRVLGRPLIEAARDYELDALARRVSATREPATAVITFGVQRIPLRAAAIPIEAAGEWAVLLLLTDLTEVHRVDQVRRDFVSNVSHELRTPLASIRALAETIESGGTDPGEETAAFARRITEQVDRLAVLVNELLELSRIESGALELRPTEVDIGHLAGRAAALLKVRSDGAGVTIDLPPEGTTLEADPDALQRLLSNLLDNAIKFSPRGGLVTVGATATQDAVVVTVTDQGPGIPRSELPRLFERFYKGDTSRSGAGVGLGLAIVKHLARSHGGVVEVESNPGQGSTFSVRLPRRFAGPGPRTP